MSDFWTRRRAAARAEAAAEETAQKAHTRAVAEADKTDEELLAELNLPHPDTLELGSDFTAFMRAAVPHRLKSMALRRLWRLNPVLANLDGLVDYGEDYTDAATCVPNLVTDYQVGKGLRAHVEHLEEVARRALASEESSDQPDEVPEDSDEDIDTSEYEIAALGHNAPPADDAADTEAEPDPTRYRMSFRFEEGASA